MAAKAVTMGLTTIQELCVYEGNNSENNLIDN
jgi:hypothetical protein